MQRPATLAEVAVRRRTGEDFGFLLSEFLDTFYGTLSDDAVNAAALIADAPAALDEAHEHAMLGAAAEHLARRWNLPIPAWSNDPSRFLSRPYFTSRLDGFKALLFAESPLAFRRRMIFTEAEPFRRARMPRETKALHEPS